MTYFNILGMHLTFFKLMPLVISIGMIAYCIFCLSKIFFLVKIKNYKFDFSFLDFIINKLHLACLFLVSLMGLLGISHIFFFYFIVNVIFIFTLYLTTCIYKLENNELLTFRGTFHKKDTKLIVLKENFRYGKNNIQLVDNKNVFKNVVLHISENSKNKLKQHFNVG